MKQTKKSNKKKILIILLILCIFFCLVGCFFYISHINKEKELKKEKELINEITSHYNTYVKANNNAILYNNNEEIGLIANNTEFSLEDIEINKNTKYFKVKDFADAYVKYEDVSIIENLSLNNDRYKNYILFNENIITKEVTNFYDENDNLVYTFYKNFDLPIIVKDTNKYGIEFNNKLLYIKNEDVLEIKENNNTSDTYANKIRVIAYHAFYDKDDPSEAWCRNSICHSTEQIESHAKYISENNYFTLNMNELEMFIDGKINVPQKSLVITVDDGLLAERGIETFIKYELNATIFLITTNYKPESYTQSKYIEFHSHGNNIHNVGECPGGQGGGIKCLKKELLQEDLKTSREILNGSSVFCYPFYEYNNYAIENLKEAGFTMAFGGLIGSGYVTKNTNKYLIPRYTIYNNTTDLELSYIIS